MAPACAVKMLRRQDAVRVDRFRNEIRIQKLLTHERIAGFGCIMVYGMPIRVYLCLGRR